MPTYRLIKVIAATAVLLIATAAPATAAPATAASAGPRPPVQLPGTVSGPTPVPAPPIQYSAGDVCPFAVSAEFPVNQVVAYTYTDRQGRTVAQYFTGALTGRITRPDSGKSITVDLSGDGVEVYDQAGNATLYGYGPYLLSLHAGDSPAHELAQPSGLSELQISASGHKNLVFASHVRNLCDALG